MALDQVDVDKIEETGNEMSFLEHLEELRWHLVRSAVAVIFFGIITFLGGKSFFEFIMKSPMESDFWTYRTICKISETLCFDPPRLELIAIELGEQFIIHFKFSLMFGIVISFPYLFWEFWRFIKPGLYPKERKAARGVVFICSSLFISGVLFGYFIIAPFAITFLGNYDLGAISTTSLSSYVSYMIMFTLPVGVVYELPVVVYFLSKIGLITPEFLRNYRKHAFVLILVLAAIITPPDVVTQFLIGFPLYFLYEVGIIISKRVVAKQKKQEELEEAALKKTDNQ